MNTLPSHQRGVALAVSLILLVIATLIGLASVRGTTLQERMSANMYDRSLAFQRAESALRAAEALIMRYGAGASLASVDCSAAAGVICPVVPEDAFSGASANWIRADDAQAMNDARTPGQPEYFIQFMGSFSQPTGADRPGVNPGSNPEIDRGIHPGINRGLNQGLDPGAGANGDQGTGGNDVSQPDRATFYRVTARSSAPVDAIDRSIVVLQAIVKRAEVSGTGLDEAPGTDDQLHGNPDFEDLHGHDIHASAREGRVSWREIVN
jgi:type IV pilus assembly protein PilX